MTSPIKQNLLIMGLPKTGKTTFLAALWHIVQSNEISTALSLNQLFADDEHLNAIRRRWLSFKEFERTKMGSEPIVTLRLHSPAEPGVIDVIFPDLSGETFQQQWEYRQWSVEYGCMARNAHGAILFLHPDQLNKEITIAEANKVVAELDGVLSDVNTEEESIAIEWEPKHSATQTQVVELIQFIGDQELKKSPFKIAIVVSAWDKLRHLNTSPEIWIESHLPLLKQFLIANEDSFTHHIYGVSAQGGDLKLDYDNLARLQKSSERIEVIGPEVGGHDLTGILKWAMS